MPVPSTRDSSDLAFVLMFSPYLALLRIIDFLPYVWLLAHQSIGVVVLIFRGKVDFISSSVN